MRTHVFASILLLLAVTPDTADGQMVAQKNGTVLDPGRGLVWQQGESSRMPWAAAGEFCRGLKLGNRSDWRLPTREELKSLVVPGRRDPAVETALFPKAKTTAYWTSSREEGRIWGIGFSDGEEYLFGGEEPTLLVRCVAAAGAQYSGPLAAAEPLPAPAKTAPPSPESFLTQWADAWSRQDVDRYLSFYGEQYHPAGSSRDAWKEARRQALSRPKWIEVQLQDLQTSRADGRVEVVFGQTYRSDVFQDKVRKKILLEERNGTWSILREDTVAVLD